ncbi:uncharacterized protein PODANS_1_17610 [Podospora anserina S mat+]|uniref:Podospora anserina S mat+ genomic DNA chromosome 1, supercontig 4 n=1 Tax=Podospora anserina (strain S / ATCC MYA-4624 / DSM 980 / FGSC 10383) TaxID=515849 RepID=B2AU10_PODAN|nr:uncharacterized protein PODANS_1_17610 [Podospora anserina S mat+]CAP67883.1 unnamed protein product [Podospora anserina S mat+]CDP24142.1 Putative protein of unknown function [Podospora anserina S mat+]
MVSAFPMDNFYRGPLSVDTNHAQKYFEEEADSILDDNILDQSGIDSGFENSPSMTDSRRDSFAVAPSLFSPKTESWQQVDMQAVPSNNPFFDAQSNNPFLQMDRGQHAVYANQTWPMTSSGSATPQMQTFDGLPAEYDSAPMNMFPKPSPFQVQATPFGNPGPQPAMFQQLPQSMPTSPHKDVWMAQDVKSQALKRPRPASPLIRSHNDLRRGDGIRKKNARFDIPAERNLTNIDQLIAQSTDEQEIKELKQQKRLLRNRQAALDSRQRKKLHTERLEDEKKHFTEVISSLEDTIADLQRELEKLSMEKQDYQTYAHNLERERDELISKHTIESGELRKKIGVLTNHVQSMEGATSNAPGFPGAFNEMDGITMDGSWENMPVFGEFPLEQTAEVKQEMQLVSTKKPEIALPTDSEKPAQPGGLLFMLFLVGAFVLSSRSTPSIPRVSEDVRAASATLLENVLKDAGVSGQAPSGVAAMAPQPSGTSWTQASGSSLPLATPMVDNVAPSMLGEMADALTQPTEQQTNEQIFSLTAAQYNDLTSQDFLPSAGAERTTSQGRRNLAEALANMRNANKQSAAEVYTRSLLWDQVPSDVVRSFAKMIAESNSAQASSGNDRS